MNFLNEQLKIVGDGLIKVKISRYQINVFLINIVLVFVMVVLQHLHLTPPAFFSTFSTITSPLPKSVDFFDSIIPKLEIKESSYQIKKGNSFIPQVSASGDYDRASSYVVINYDTGEVLASKESSQEMAVASLTKLMTAVVALDLASSDEQFMVTKTAAEIEPTKIGVVEGQYLTLNELLHAALITSANDAVEVIKDGINAKYSHDVLVRSMNAKAQFLDLKNSHFTNPQGFDADQPFSSAEDLAVLSHYALTNYPLIEKIVGKEYQFLPANEFHKQFDLYNWNGLLGVYPGVYGIKIGNTEDAGRTSIVISQREGQKVLVVLLGAPGVLERDLWASQLLDLGFGKLGMDGVNITEQQLKNKYSTWKYWN